MANGIALCILVVCFSYLFYFRFYFQEKKETLVFDNRVLSVIDGLYLSGMKFGCTAFEMRAYAKDLLKKAHSLPDTETLLKHTVTNSGIPALDGFTFRSHTGLFGDHITFALLCIINFAKECDNFSLLHQCEQLLLEARDMGTHYSNS